MRPASLTLSLLLLGGCATPGRPAPLDEREVLRRSLPGVVLVVTQLPGAKIGYGSGLVAGEPRRVLTNMHVVAEAEQIRIMRWQPDRATYIPQEGGLARFLFENEAALEPATLRKADPELDLAVLDAPGLDALPALPWSDEPPRPGDRVLALGHPAETVWSFTAGVISSLHNGAVQTDAAINVGNSGGPLIDTRGRVIGLNTSRLVGSTQGIGFARPIALARGLLADAAATLTVDRSDPRKAHLTCLNAVERGNDAYLDCIDVEGFATFLQRVREESFKRAQLPADFEQRVRAGLVPLDRDVAKKLFALSYEAMRQPKNTPLLPADATDREKRYAEALERAVKQQEPLIDATILRRTGMKVTRNDFKAIQRLLQLGSRVTRIAEAGDRAWIEIEGQNLDHTPWRLSELWLRTPTGWVERQALLPGDEATLPPGYAPTLLGADAVLDAQVSTQVEALRALLPR